MRKFNPKIKSLVTLRCIKKGKNNVDSSLDKNKTFIYQIDIIIYYTLISLKIYKKISNMLIFMLVYRLIDV